MPTQCHPSRFPLESNYTVCIRLISLRFADTMGTEPKERTGNFLSYTSHHSDLSMKIWVNLWGLTRETIKIYATFQLNRKLNDPESGHNLFRETSLMAGFLLLRDWVLNWARPPHLPHDSGSRFAHYSIKSPQKPGRFPAALLVHGPRCV